MAKPELREKARALRREGKSVKYIQKALGVSSSSVSRWVKSVELTEEQKQALRDASGGDRRALVGEEALAKRRERAEQRWKQAEEEAEKQWPELVKDPLFGIGLGCYIGEGTKGNGVVTICNSDLFVVKNFIEFSRLIGADIDRMRLTVHMAYDPTPEQRKAVLEHWLAGLGVSPSQLAPQPIILKRGAGPLRNGGEGSRRSLLYGVARFGCTDVQLSKKLHWWMRKALGK